MTGPWSGYDSLLPSEHDLGQDWRKMPVLPPMHGGLILPYGYTPERRPSAPQLDLPDGMVAEAIDILKDGGVVPFRMQLGYEDEVGCLHTFACSHEDIRHAVEVLLQRLSTKSRMRLTLIAEPGKTDGIVLDDKDGRDIPEVRFWIAPGTRCGHCNDRVCSCQPTAAERRAVTIRESLARDRSATAAENGRIAASPSEIG